MRNAIIFFCCFVNFSYSQQYGWYKVYNPSGARIVSIEFVDSLFGWIYNQGVGTSRTTDGGNTWSAPITGNRVILYSLSFLDRKSGWAIGTNNVDDSAIYKTNDSGKTWHELYFSYDKSTPSGIGLSMEKVIAVGNETNLPLPDTALIIKSTDGGATFGVEKFFRNDALEFQKVLFPDTLHGFIHARYKENFEYKDVLFKTNNGGESWWQQEMSSPSFQFAISLNTITFLDSLHGWGWRGYFFRTTDGGVTWDSIYPGVPLGVGLHAYDLIFLDTLNGWAFGGGFNGGLTEVIYRTTDGGYSWNLESIGLSYPSALQGKMLSTTCGYAAAWEAVLKYGIVNDVEEEKELTEKFLLENNFPNPFNSSTIIKWQINSQSRVTLKIFDTAGKEVALLIHAEKTAGRYETEFDAGKYKLASGVYYCKIEVTDTDTKQIYSETKSMIYLK